MVDGMWRRNILKDIRKFILNIKKHFYERDSTRFRAFFLPFPTDLFTITLLVNFLSSIYFRRCLYIPNFTV